MLLFNKFSYFVLDTANYCVYLLMSICSCHSFSVVYIYSIYYYLLLLFYFFNFFLIFFNFFIEMYAVVAFIIFIILY